MNVSVKWILALALAAAVNVAFAKPRDISQLKAMAREALNEYGKVRRANDARDIAVLENRAGLVVMGYEQGGFAIMARDDAFAAVLATSETKYDANTQNANFLYWLHEVEKMTDNPPSQPLPLIKPDTDRFPESVEPLLKTKWGQSYPYNMYCPNNCPTGCVATAASQVLKHHEWPKQGKANVFVFWPFGDFDGTKCEVEPEGAEFDYANMQNSYEQGKFVSQQQKKAVATLMYHMGLAMKAQYETAGTGSYNETLCHGLRNTLYYPFAVTVNSDDYTAKEWMDKIFEQLSSNSPLVYGGSDKTYTGHEFVLHGYDKNGKVYINWGWDGSEDGYFDISQLLLYWGLYDFSNYQDMVLRCNPEKTTTNCVEVEVREPGTLGQLLTQEQIDTTVWLSVRGQINSTDLLTLRRMAGAGQTGQGVWGNLSYLNLENAEIIAGGEPYLIEDGVEYTTEDGVMPYKAFANCNFLVDVRLPQSIVGYSDGVFAGCLNLDNVGLETSVNASFVADSNFVMTADRKELIEWIPTGTDVLHVVIPDGVEYIHDYALAGRYLYERLTIPESVDRVGAFAFNRCFDLSRTYIMAATPPEIDETAIDPLDISLRKLYVPEGAKADYLKADGWKKYGSRRIVEFSKDGVESFAEAKPNAICNSKVYGIGGQMYGTGQKQKGFYIQDGKKFLIK